MKVLNFSMIKLTFCFVSGVILGAFLSLPLVPIVLTSILLFLVTAILFLRARKRWIQDVFFGSAVYLLLIVLGILNWNLQLPKNNDAHYANHISGYETYALKGQVVDVLKSYTSYDNYVLSLKSLDTTNFNGKLLLKIKRDSLISPLEVDDIIALNGLLEPIRKPLNPHQFDYANYMKHQKVLFQTEANAFEIFVISSSVSSFTGYAHASRNHIEQQLIDSGFRSEELGIIKALLLGQKDDISRETYNSYASAGVVHILAVSGLHVGIVLMILQFLLTPFFNFKNGNVYKSVIIVIMLWAFAFLAGLSPSVMRAVTMFSFVAFAINWNRKTSTINTLFLSAFVLLLWNAEMIFQVGFQLSYLAVFSIVLLQPVLFNLIPRPKYWIARLFWGVFTVTIAAQVGVFPLSLFYFHQFPGLFFVTNVLIIPFLGIILGYGILCIVLALIGWLPSFLVEGFSTIIKAMNGLISWVAQQKSFLFQDIYFSEIQTLSTYLLITVILLSLRNFKARKLIYILIAAIICQAGFFYDRYLMSSAEEFIVFHQTAHTALGFRNADQLHLKTDTQSLDNFYLNRTISNYKVGSGISTINHDSLGNSYFLNSELLFIIDSLGVYDSSFSGQTILLRNSPKVNLNRLIDSIKPILIIADGSNYTSYVKRWRNTCSIKKLPFHHTGEKGAFLIKE